MNDEVVAIRATSLASEPIVIEPQYGVRIPIVLSDGRWLSVTRRKGGVIDLKA